MHDLEFLRELFQDDKLHIGIGVVTQLALNNDQSILRLRLKLLPDNREVIGQMTWGAVNASEYPLINELRLVFFIDGHPDECFIGPQISTPDEKIPTFAQSGHKVVYSHTGKKLYLGSSSKVGIGRPNVEPSEPLVLGNVLKTALQALANAFINNAASLGADNSTTATITLNPTIVTALNTFVSTYLTTAGTNVLSQIAYTERGV